MSLQKPEAFRFKMKNDCQLVLYGCSEKEALMEHLTTATRRAGHQISLAEAKDIDSDLVLVEPTEYLRWFDSFDQAAEKAWNSVYAPKEPEKFTFRTNAGDKISLSGESERDALTSHLIEKTKEVGHQISFKEAENPGFVVMVRPSEFVQAFGSFDEAARRAWVCTCSADEAGLTA